jgi:membrane protein involved in D-alanine export
VTPYGNFTYFALLLYIVVPTIILGFLGRAGWRWALFSTCVVLAVQFQRQLPLFSTFVLREIWVVLGFAAWQLVTLRLLAVVSVRNRWVFYGAIVASLLPLAAAKVAPLLLPGSEFGFLGISYVTFRALDVIFCLRDKVISSPPTLDFLACLFFFPTISSGPIDRYRRFTLDWRKKRTRAEFLLDLDQAVHRIFRGFLYKFIIAALIKQYWLDRAAEGAGLLALLSYMYAFSLYLFFDFAGYSAFAIAFSYLFGVHTPENFDRPFLARDIRDFWNRWHITLSFWFRDHVYMRFLLAAARGKWFANKHTAAIIAYFLAFGLMGLWHGIKLHFILYGLYQAALLSGFDIFSRWNQARGFWRDTVIWRAAGIFITFQCVCFGFLIFSGRIGAPRMLSGGGTVERADCEQISGWIWDKDNPDAAMKVDLDDQKTYLLSATADQYRPDLAAAGYGNGRHGFAIPTPKQLKDGNSHTISVHAAGSRRVLENGRREIVCR